MCLLFEYYSSYDYKKSKNKKCSLIAIIVAYNSVNVKN